MWSEPDRAAFSQDGFVVKANVINAADADVLAAHYHDLFAGRFPTGIFPDEWHWRENVSLPSAPREIVNGWKSSLAVARIALSPLLAQAAAELLSWRSGTRLAQDDVLWKPAGAGGIGYHQDSAYISDQFVPRDDNSVTVWIALDDADKVTGAVEYAVGSHLWRAKNRTACELAQQSFHGVGGNDLASPAYAAAEAVGIDPSAVELRTVSVPKGSAIFHHQDVWHGSRANTHPSRPRRALALHFLRRDVSFRTAKPPDYIYGRYVLGRGRPEVDEAFFPIVWAPDGHKSDTPKMLAKAGLIATETRSSLPSIVPPYRPAALEDDTAQAGDAPTVATQLRHMEEQWRHGGLGA